MTDDKKDAEKQKLAKMIENLEKYMLGDADKDKLDSQLIFFINSNGRVPLTKNLRALLKRIYTGKYQEVGEDE